MMGTGAFMSMAYGIIYFYPQQMPILRRETNEHIYDFSGTEVTLNKKSTASTISTNETNCLLFSAYYVAEVFNILPVSFLRSFAGLPILYLWAGFDIGPLLYLQMGLILLAATFTGNAYGLFISGVFKSIKMEVATVFDLFFFSFAGIYMNLSSVSFARFISPFFYVNEALSILFWTTITQIGNSCFWNDIRWLNSITFPKKLLFFFISQSECPLESSGQQCTRNGIEVLETYSYNTNPSGFVYDFVGLIVLGLVMHVLAFIGVKKQITTVGYY